MRHSVQARIEVCHVIIGRRLIAPVANQSRGVNNGYIFRYRVAQMLAELDQYHQRLQWQTGLLCMIPEGLYHSVLAAQGKIAGNQRGQLWQQIIFFGRSQQLSQGSWRTGIE